MVTVTTGDLLHREAAILVAGSLLVDRLFGFRIASPRPRARWLKIFCTDSWRRVLRDDCNFISTPRDSDFIGDSLDLDLIINGISRYIN